MTWTEDRNVNSVTAPAARRESVMQSECLGCCFPAVGLRFMRLDVGICFCNTEAEEVCEGIESGGGGLSQICYILMG